MTRAHTVVPSPIGPLTVVREDDELVRLAMSPPTGLDPEELGARPTRGFDDVVRQLSEYFAGERTALRPAVRPAGSASSWPVMGPADHDLPTATTRSYDATSPGSVGRASTR